MKTICVYCGSNQGQRPEYLAAAKTLAAKLVSRQMSVVYGGACVGIMGALADSTLALGGEVIGVMPQSLVDKEVAHPNLSKLIIVNSMHQRKSKMAELADGFIALPGGLGTIEELFEMLTWSQLGFHSKPCALLNVSGYFDKLIGFINHAAGEGFVKKNHAEMLITSSEIDNLLDRMESYQAPVNDKWIRT